MEPNKGTMADNAMRALNIGDIGIQGIIGFERLRRLAQGRAALANQASKLSKGYSGYSAPLSLGIEALNTAWLMSDKDKRDRALKEFEVLSDKPAVERMIESAINPSDTLFSYGKTLYDTGKTYESVERSQMDEINNSLQRKIDAHEKQIELERKKKPEKSELAEYVMSAMNMKSSKSK